LCIIAVQNKNSKWALKYIIEFVPEIFRKIVTGKAPSDDVTQIHTLVIDKASLEDNVAHTSVIDQVFKEEDVIQVPVIDEVFKEEDVKSPQLSSDTLLKLCVCIQ